MFVSVTANHQINMHTKLPNIMESILNMQLLAPHVAESLRVKLSTRTLCLTRWDSLMLAMTVMLVHWSKYHTQTFWKLNQYQNRCQTNLQWPRSVRLMKYIKASSVSLPKDPASAELWFHRLWASLMKVITTLVCTVFCKVCAAKTQSLHFHGGQSRHRLHTVEYFDEWDNLYRFLAHVAI